MSNARDKYQRSLLSDSQNKIGISKDGGISELDVTKEILFDVKQT